MKIKDNIIKRRFFSIDAFERGLRETPSKECFKDTLVP